MMKESWVDRCKNLEELQKELEYSVRDLSRYTGYSIYVISMDLNLAAAIRAYPEMKDIKSYVKAIKYMKKKKFKRKIDAKTE